MIDLDISSAYKILLLENGKSAASVVKVLGVTRERMRQSLRAKNPGAELLNNYCQPAGFTLSQLFSKAEQIPRREVK